MTNCVLPHIKGYDRFSQNMQTTNQHEAYTDLEGWGGGGGGTDPPPEKFKFLKFTIPGKLKYPLDPPGNISGLAHL